MQASSSARSCSLSASASVSRTTTTSRPPLAPRASPAAAARTVERCSVYPASRRPSTASRAAASRAHAAPKSSPLLFGRHRSSSPLAVANAANAANASKLIITAGPGTYPVPETEKERSPIDFPQEWVTPAPSRRPDTQPEFERLEAVPPPRKLPGDPELPDEEEAEEEEKKRPAEPGEPGEGEPGEGDPDKEEPEGPIPEG